VRSLNDTALHERAFGDFLDRQRLQTAAAILACATDFVQQMNAGAGMAKDRRRLC
jgi:hypothetical protein